ncbi:MAG: inorganic phosphate transporter [Ruminiclostridium sp.]|nr:inorganic phosphate transporter [Ruminiclostridium sp.]
MQYALPTVITIIICLTFTFINGFHDGCNVMATVVASKTMSPQKALIFACIAEFTAPLLLGTAVANTVGRGILDINRLNRQNYSISIIIILSALIGGILWNLFTWKAGLPSSSSHALIGGLIGSGMTIFGPGMINWNNLFWKVIVMLVLTPITGFVAGYVSIRILNILIRRCTRSVNKIFKFIQVFSMFFLASSHSSNDAQKSMGVIAIILLIGGINKDFGVPVWTMFLSAFAISAGLLMGGWSIVKTVGTKIFRVRPIHSFNSQMTAALVITTAGLLGYPVSTTQIVSSSIMGTGAGEKLNAVNWGVVKSILTSWLITIPCSAAFSAVVCFVLKTVIY